MHYNPQQTHILALCADGQWHCQKEFQVISWCAHKRRAEIEKKGEYEFLKRDCEHNIKGSNDWRMFKFEKPEEKKEVEGMPIYKLNGKDVKVVGLFPSYPPVNPSTKRWTEI